MVFSNQCYASSASSLKRVFGDWILGLIVVHHFVHRNKALPKCVFIVSVFVLWKFFENFDKFLLYKKCNFFASVAIKNSKKRFAVGQFDLGNVRILLLIAPSLHAAT
jgi:hypothetical protein